jgi:HupH hydrogenase expression protein, C-terminal conserved region
MTLPESLISCTPPLTGMTDSILSEIAERLRAFALSGEGTVIDLRSLPMSDADRSELESQLGHGEVEIKLHVSGQSDIWETTFAGVWWVRHFDGDGRIAAEEINIISVPDIIRAHPDDARTAASRLTRIITRESNDV